MISHFDPAEDIVRELSSSKEAGLTEDAVVRLKEKYGSNVLAEKKKKSMFMRFLDQFKDVMIIILLAAAAVSFAIALKEGDAMEFFEPALILLIVVLNAVIGVIQESRAEKALDALKNMSAPKARVIRGGKERMIDSKELVPGDIIRLEAGDMIPADARLLESASLKCEESALTGESVPAEKDFAAAPEKDAPLGDRVNMVYSGCSVTNGTAKAIVTATGMNTEMGKIAGMLESEGDEATPLQKKLSDLGKYLGIMALLACGVIFAVGYLNNIAPLEIFMTSVSLAVSAIPEGLPAIVTIVLAIGVQRMVKKNALIRRLPAVETLGSASVICSDKTGTLTQNKMTLKKLWVDGERDTENIIGNNSERARLMLLYASLCCDAKAEFTKEGERFIGDPTETAILSAAHENGIDGAEIEKSCPRLFELPFDSDRKLMTTVNKIDGKNIVIVKGAFDMLAPKCIKGDLDTASLMNEKMSSDALRVLAVAYKEIELLPKNPTSDSLETELMLLGLVGMIDPPRPEAKEAVTLCRKAGIRPVMITGDHVITASAIARELGILNDGDIAVTGTEVDAMTDEVLKDSVDKISVYARVSPENKIRIVKAWQSKGEVVAMTGDGVNDAPALKAADIGCAMGVTGTDVAKGAADMTLTDDNFATIVDAVKEGRGIYSNIKKVVSFLLGTNIGEVLTVFSAMLLWHTSPLVSMQLLWINLVTDSLPAIALGTESVESDVMSHKPKPKSEGIFAHGMGLRTVLQGAMFAVLSLIAFILGGSATGTLEGGQTLTFLVLSLSQIVQAYNMRSEHSLFKIGPFTNHGLNKAALISVILVALVLFTPLRIAFSLVILPAKYYLYGLGLIFVPLVVMEFSKAAGLIKHQK